MPKSLALEVTKESIIKALDKIISENPKLNGSTKHDLVYKDQRFPPKEVIREAARIQGIKNWWEFNLSGGDSTNIPLKKMGFTILNKNEVDLEDKFIKLLQKAGEENCSLFFKCVDQIKSKLNWLEGDSRFSYGTSENNKLSITIGQRYCLVFQVKEEKPWQFIASNKLKVSKQTEISEFQGTPLAFYYRSKDVQDLLDNIDSISEACNLEMVRTQVSGFTKYSNQIFEDAIFNSDYRMQLFNKAFGNETIQLNEITMKSSLNTILYGPPGTGKTYNSINKALEILGVNVEELTRQEIKNEYDKRVTDGQIVFTTFHQSMNYEDFIEGIKPKTVDGKIIYEIEDGIFKQLCNKARFVSGNLLEVLEKFKNDISEQDGKPALTIKAYSTTFDIVFRGTNVFYVQPHNSTKVNPWYPVNINHIKVAFETEKYDGLYNPTYIREVIRYLENNYKLKKENKNVESKPYVIIIDEINRGNVSQIFGELITLIEEDKREGNKESISLVLPYSKEKFSVPANLYILGTMNTADRSIEALDTALRRRFSFIEMPPLPELINKVYLEKYCDLYVQYYEFDDEHEPWANYERDFISLLNRNKDTYEKMSFGTLGKYIKKENPKENYNRLFDMFKQKEITFLPVDLLITINNRIEVLLDADHQIGHSFFIGINNLSDLKYCFKNKILPLLQEYFYGDYGKIGCVIGESFFVQNSAPLNNESFLLSFRNYDLDSFSEKQVYKIKDIDKMSDNEFLEALSNLLNVE